MQNNSESLTLKLGEISHEDSPNILLLDFDSGEITERYENAKNQLSLCDVTWTLWDIQTSDSGAFHFIVTLKHELPLIYRVALQCICGSDPKREAINFFRCCQTIECTCFAESEQAHDSQCAMVVFGNLKNILFSAKGEANVQR